VTITRDEARAQLGVTGSMDTTPLRRVLSTAGVGYYPVFAIGVLAIVDQFQGYAFTVLTPDISAALGIGVGAIAAARAIQTLVNALSPLPMAALSQRKARRAALCIATGVGWSVVTLFTGVVAGFFTLLVVLALDGLTTGSVAALHYPLLMDSYPPSARVRILARYNACIAFGNVLSPLMVAVLSTIVALTWRGDFVVLGFIAVGGTMLTLGLRDPGYGKWDTERLRTTTDEDIELHFFEVVQRLLLIPTIRRLFAGYLVFGILLIPFATFLSFFLEERWNLGPGGRGLFFAVTAATSVTALLVFGRRGERLFQADPGRLTLLAGGVVGIAVILVAAGALVPVFGLMIALFAAGQALVAILAPCLSIVMLSVVPSRHRPHASALAGIFIAGGAVLGSLLLGGIDARYGIGGSIVALIIPGVAGALIVASAGKFVATDLDRMIDDVLEDEQVRQTIAAGGSLPLLACRRICFFYGDVQILFGVDLTITDGEMVALLGVNGAGKSTLLNVISGLGLPQSGSVRCRGQDITYLDAERRLGLGIAQIPGGRAVFGPMTVVDNLRTFGFTLGRDHRRLDGLLDTCFATFPRLAERRNQQASTLSGGEQQMLGLCKALILEPRVLLIDELSLGLAPVMVAQLLEMVREVNRRGTAIVLVEQSVNIALSLVDHAYFMEKGEIRFDGPASELRDREDLLRAVFLEGVGNR
jgi:ABC-type branched-subunit amino acid transport system ATPase component/sugar phosphate permease